MSKLKAFLIHFAITFGVLIVLALLVYIVWYPKPYYQFLSVSELFFVTAFVVLIIFPLLTALIYKPNKKTLRLDILVILALQLISISFGIWVLAESRPAWMVLANDRFYVVRPIDLRDEYGEIYTMPLYKQPWTGPEYVTLIPTEKSIDINRRREANLLGSAALFPIDFLPLKDEHITDALLSFERLELEVGQQHNMNINDYSNAKFYIPVVGVDGQEVAIIIYDDFVNPITMVSHEK